MSANPYQISAFAHVANEGSFSAAAKKLRVSQSAISQHISKFEKEVGSKVFYKNRDGLALTQTGSELYELANRFVKLEQQIGEKISRYAELDTGYLNIIANAPLPALRYISNFSSLFPNVEIDFTLYDWTTANNLLDQNQADIAFITEPSSRPDWESYLVDRVKYVLYVSSEHKFSKRRQISLNELSQEPLLLPEKGSLTEREVRRVLKKFNIQISRLIKTTTFPVMKEAILQGVGVGIFLEKSTTERDSLIAIPIEEMSRVYETHLVVPNSKAELRLVRHFLASL